MSKEFKVTEEMIDIWDEYVVCIECRDECIRSIFKTKRAIYYGKQGEKARRNFWALVRKLYPETVGEQLTYNSEATAVTITVQQDKEKT